MMNLINALHNVLVEVDSVQFSEIESAANRTVDCVESINLRHILADNGALFVEYEEIRDNNGMLLDEKPTLCARADSIADVLRGICGLTANDIACMLCRMGEISLSRFC